MLCSFLTCIRRITEFSRIYERIFKLRTKKLAISSSSTFPKLPIITIFLLSFTMSLTVGQGRILTAQTSTKNVDGIFQNAGLLNNFPKFHEAKTNKFLHGRCTFCRLLRLYLQIAKIHKDTTTKENVLRSASKATKSEGRTTPESTLIGKLNFLHMQNTRNSDTFKRRTYETNAVEIRTRRRRSTGDRRIKKLYCRTGYTLRIHKNGKVDGTRERNSPLGYMEIRTVGRGGVVSIKSTATGRYLSMSKSGILSSTATYDPNKNAFVERITEGWFNTYAAWRPSSKRTRNLYVALSKYGRSKRGNKISQSSRTAQFLPLS